MMEKTQIKGKDKDLESSIAFMHEQLLSLGFDIEEVSWLNPVDGVYSVHIRDKACHALFTNGKGSAEKACLASALGEFFERLSCNYFFADYYLGEATSLQTFVHYPNEQWFEVYVNQRPEGLMNDDLWSYFDPENNLDPANLFDTNSGAGERGICALPFVQLSKQKVTYIPVNIIGNIFVSNGMSAGNTYVEAKVQALSEICERYVKHQVISQGLCLPDIPQAVIDRFPMIAQSIQAIKDYGYHLKVSDASLGGVYPVASVTLINPKDGSVFASFGAHPCFEVALERTVTELLQGRGLNQMDVFHAPIFDLDAVASAQNIEMHFIDSSGDISNDFFRSEPDYAYYDWNTDATTVQEYQNLTSLIHQQGYEIYCAEYDHLGIPACRILVPGMSDIYPVDELVWENNNEGAIFRETLLNLDKLDAAGMTDLLDNLDEGGYNDQTLIAQFIGLLPDADSGWARLRLGEVKAMLSLALQTETALEWVDWCLALEELTDPQLRHYRCVKALLEIKWHDGREYDNYMNGLALLYGQKTADNALKVVEGDVVFNGLISPGLSLNGMKQHHQLLEAYEKLKEVKTINRG
ncbi:MAG: 30S ribosomal protein S12 methylthiotransferase accessory factor YcaO [Gammaproteobacteria bacterium]